MKLDKICKVCTKHFTAIKTTQSFCCRKCFKKDYYVRSKAKLGAERAKPHFPMRSCAYCGTNQVLLFDPVKSPHKFSDWECIMCGVTNKILWKYQDNPRSGNIIAALLKTLPVRQYTITAPQVVTIHASFVTIVDLTPKPRHVEAPASVPRQWQFATTLQHTT